MAEEKSNYLEDMKRYQYGELAKRLSQSKENQRFVPGALEQLASDIKEISESENLLLKDLIKKGQGLESILEVYPAKYGKEYNNLTVEELLSHYEKILNDYLTKERVMKIKENFGKVGGEKLGDIEKKLNKAMYDMLGKQKGYREFSEKELKSIQDVIGKYGLIKDILNLLEDIKFEELRPTATENAYRQELTKKVDELYMYSSD